MPSMSLWPAEAAQDGLFSATAIVTSCGRREHFASMCQFASCLGVTPREHSSGGKQMLLGIIKRGNKYVRKLLIHGARGVLPARQNKDKVAYAEDRVVKLARRRGPYGGLEVSELVRVKELETENSGEVPKAFHQTILSTGNLSRAAYYRNENKLAARDARVVEALNEVVDKHGRWGFWKCHGRLRCKRSAGF